METREETLEALLVETKKQVQRLELFQKVQGAVTVLLLLAICIGIFTVNSRLRTATEGIPALVTTTQEAVAEVNTFVKSVEEIDLLGLSNKAGLAADSINELDMEALNRSIQNLEKVAEKLAGLFG